MTWLVYYAGQLLSQHGPGDLPRAIDLPDGAYLEHRNAPVPVWYRNVSCYSRPIDESEVPRALKLLSLLHT